MNLGRSLQQQHLYNVELQLSTTSSEPTDIERAAYSSTKKDGGTRAWLSVAGSFLIFVNIWGFTFIFGVFQSFYELSYLPGESTSSISWIGTIGSALLVIVGVLAGPLFDRGLNKHMMIAGSLLILLGLFTLSLSTRYYQVFLSQGLAVGIGSGLLYIPALAHVSGSFTEKRALALGIVTCGIGLGGVIYIAAFQSLLPQLGFAWAVRVLAFIALGIFSLAIPTLIFSSPPKTKPSTTRKLFDTAAFRDPPFLAYATSTLFIFIGYLVPFFYIPSYGQIVLGMSRQLSFWALAISSATSIIGRVGCVLIAQRIGSMPAWIGSGVTSSILCFSWIGVSDSKAGFFVFCSLYGFFSAGLGTLPATVFPRICSDPQKYGTWLGMGFTASGVAFLIGAPIAGALASLGASQANAGVNFLPIQIWSGTMMGLGSAVLCILWMLLSRLRPEQSLSSSSS